MEFPTATTRACPSSAAPPGLTKAQNYLYRNNGDGTFTDVSKESGVSAARGSYGLSVVCFDADEDGWPDIFVACDVSPSLLLMNNHDGTFREEGLFRGVALSGEGRQMGGMGAAPATTTSTATRTSSRPTFTTSPPASIATTARATSTT